MIIPPNRFDKRRFKEFNRLIINMQQHEITNWSHYEHHIKSKTMQRNNVKNIKN
jgi:hypothetical protein